MIKKILIANRGEIACRIIKTAKKLKIKTVSIYSDSDINAEHVLMSDESYYLGPSEASKSYLNISKIIEICKKAEVDAVHPGYGFLSENPNFVRELTKNKIIFIGPSENAIISMGDKIKSKMIAEKASVNVVPGFIGEINNVNHAKEIAKKIGFPVIVKASAGGGGKGMRIVNSEEDVEEAFLRASSEAKNSFGDERLFVEKYLVEPRHIEIQIIADNYGNVVSLGERECSIQRRNQKVIEEAPSSFLDETLRRDMSTQAIMLAKEVEYSSAGTVEFIVDKDKNFYFLEMNTRLQVEHPVTEMITGLDLVNEMINVANNKKLSFSQKDIKLNGWAFESRIYAEDPYKGFLPSIGRLTKYSPPSEDKSMDYEIRNDTGVKEGDEISIFYDPMIAKLSTWGKDRKSAIKFMEKALDEFCISGLKNNLSFLSSIYLNPKFVDGEISTAFIEKEFKNGFKGLPIKQYKSLFEIIILTLSAESDIRDLNLKKFDKRTSVELFDFFDNKKYISDEYIVKLDNKMFEISKLDGNLYLLDKMYNKLRVHHQIDFQTNLINIKIYEDDQILLSTFLKLNYCFPYYQIDFRGSSVKGITRDSVNLELSKFMKKVDDEENKNSLICPMPGKLIELFVKVGDQIEVGQNLCIVEAMKMENTLQSSLKGQVKKINFKVNDLLKVDDIIIEF
ncbi:MAG: acetyl/propionyl-CoA carboxylase subunit alpha [Alphaproteobacteria bacterium]|nr:MAG: acetyl/propionyl-CoA carboxylase subunit alpha [Alphaproteobacteria bacterium]